jgi:hypothetical protein
MRALGFDAQLDWLAINRMCDGGIGRITAPHISRNVKAAICHQRGALVAAIP